MHCKDIVNPFCEFFSLYHKKGEKAMNDQKLYYTIDEVRKLIYANGVSKSTLHNMINSGDIPSRRLMKRVFVPRWWVDKEIAIATHAPQEVN
jgi:hypothetical protein